MRSPEWIAKAVALALHDEQLAEHGGQGGLRDEGLLDSALERPRNRFLYGDPDIFDLAGAYAFGIARNHPFIDGNKRASLVASEGFLLLNGYEVTASEADRITVWWALSAGSTSEDEIAAWFRANSRSMPSDDPSSRD